MLLQRKRIKITLSSKSYMSFKIAQFQCDISKGWKLEFMCIPTCITMSLIPKHVRLKKNRTKNRKQQERILPSDTFYQFVSISPVPWIYERDSFRKHIFLSYLVSFQIPNFIAVPFEFYLCFWVNNIRFESSVYSTIILLFLFFLLFLLLRAVTISKKKMNK